LYSAPEICFGQISDFELKLPGVKRSQFNHERQLFHQIGWRR
jgi:hypothetical protein